MGVNFTAGGYIPLDTTLIPTKVEPKYNVVEKAYRFVT